MFFAKVSLVTALLATFASHVACGPAETNGQRMARGLPPLPPKRRDRQPTPAWGGNPRPSSTPPSPPTPYAGCLEIRDEQGNTLGRVKNSNTSSTIGGLSLSRDDGDLKVSFSVPQTGSIPFDILATNPVFSEPFYVGAAGTLDIDSLDLTSQNTLAFTNVQQTPATSIPVVSTFNSALIVESAIWSLNSQTSQLTAQYINPDGSSPATVLAYDDHANLLFFVGSIDAYNADNNNPASIVNLFLVSGDDDSGFGGNNGNNNHGNSGNNNNGFANSGSNNNGFGHGH